MIRLVTVASFCLFALCGPANAAQGDPAQLIEEAKAAIAKVDAEGYAWRDTGKVLDQAEQALAKGDKATAGKLAARALQQASVAYDQYARYYQSAGPRF